MLLDAPTVHGRARPSSAGRGEAGLGKVRQGKARLVGWCRLDTCTNHEARHGKVAVRSGMARQGLAGSGGAGLGEARQGTVFSSRHGGVRRSAVWQRMARRGWVRLGSARHGSYQRKDTQ